MDSSYRQTCLRLEVPGRENEQQEVIFIKGNWSDSRFELFITDGINTWICKALESEVKERASQWDQPVSDYIETAERHLGFRQPGSTYGFVDAGDGHKRLSWTFEKQGTTLEWRWKCKPSPDNKKTTSEILDFLMDANIRLSEEVVRKAQSFDRLKLEAEKCLAQSEKFSNEKAELESALYAKFVGVLNSKKAKLRELRDRLSKQEHSGKSPQEEEESSGKTESYHEQTDQEDNSGVESSKNDVGTSRNISTSTRYSRKRKT